MRDPLPSPFTSNFTVLVRSKQVWITYLLAHIQRSLPASMWSRYVLLVSIVVFIFSGSLLFLLATGITKFGNAFRARRVYTRGKRAWNHTECTVYHRANRIRRPIGRHGPQCAENNLCQFDAHFQNKSVHFLALLGKRQSVNPTMCIRN